MKTILIAISLLFLVSGNSYASNQIFACKLESSYELHLVFSQTTKKAELISDSSHSVGSLKFNEHHYFFIFPKTETRYEIRAIVNRYSGKLTWEIGAPPFGESSSKNIHSSGKCKISGNTKLL